ncbi:gephyrin [Ceratina calcarata]|uniref:Gephyrin n=1 Tax=Ceratina calcarata TaxID=156304 RepID=A0AAJ7WHC5_9HYME|nr:gephyrin [Ceratina calcarata]XP_026675388.1 gephyrin [Ceratina calcarata]XP_026675389.1 gephyrin [Ceratina calcarata]
MDSIRYGILTVSDSCFYNKSEDRSGVELEQCINDEQSDIGKVLKGRVCIKLIVPDEEKYIKKTLKHWVHEEVDVILTVGGTGFSKRDVTPEATRHVIQKECPGMVIAMQMSSLKITPMAMLSRAVCGIRGSTLIINLPGSPKAAKECLSAIACAIPHAVNLIKDEKDKIKSTHMIVQGETNVKNVTYPHKISSCLSSVAERDRESSYPMISIDEAKELMVREVELVNVCTELELENCLGKILATDLYSKYDLPPFRASIKDGYAVLASDGMGKRKVLAGIKAGDIATAIKLEAGTCVRVNTGAPIPDDATAVVQVEDTKLVEESLDKEESEIEIMTEVKPGQDIRPIGCDIKKDDLILKKYTKLGAIELGLAAACGYNKITTTYVPLVGVLSTGDELQCAGGPLMPGHVYDSNKITLLSMLRENGFDPIDLGIAADHEEAMVEKIRDAVQKVDVLITSGSVSMGDKDMLKPILTGHFNATIHFGRVNIKPGKPTTFATCMFKNRKKYFLCLPGNPVSATVIMRFFGFTLLNRLRVYDCEETIVRAKLASGYKLDSRPEFVRANLKWSDEDTLPTATITGNQISSKLLSCKNANSFLLLPARGLEDELQEGDVVEALLLNV